MHRSPVSLANRLAVVAALAAVVGGCGVPVVNFDVPISDETTIDGGPAFVDLILGAFGFESLANVDVENTQAFENNNVQRDQVTSARLTALTLTIAEPQGANFDWLDDIAISVEATGVDRARVGHAVVDDGKTAIRCELDDIDLVDFVHKSTLDITTNANARQPPQDTTIRIDLVLAISAEVL